jgi:hypothetical protein
MNQPLINGVQHSWASVKIHMLGRTLTGIKSVNYSDEQVKENNFGAGQFPDHRGYGNVTATAGITLYQYEVKAIQEAALGMRIQGIPMFDIIVSYSNDGGLTVETDVIRNVEFKNNVRSISQGDTMSEVALDLICSHIDWHGQVPGVSMPSFNN